MIWPRDEAEFGRMVENNLLFGVQIETGQIVALCYAILYEDRRELEIGGLAVRDGLGRMGIASTLVEFALAHAFAFNQPWASGQEIVAFVHDENNGPRKLIKDLGFQFLCKVRLPAPASMKRDADGNVSGDKFKFTVEGLHRLNAWLQAFSGTLANGKKATFNLGRNTLDDLKVALKEITAQYPKPENPSAFTPPPAA